MGEGWRFGQSLSARRRPSPVSQEKNAPTMADARLLPMEARIGPEAGKDAAEGRDDLLANPILASGVDAPAHMADTRPTWMD